jgi:hypothetical protein
MLQMQNFKVRSWAPQRHCGCSIFWRLWERCCSPARSYRWGAIFIDCHCEMRPLQPTHPVIAAGAMFAARTEGLWDCAGILRVQLGRVCLLCHISYRHLHHLPGRGADTLVSTACAAHIALHAMRKVQYRMFSLSSCVYIGHLFAVLPN